MADSASSSEGAPGLEAGDLRGLVDQLRLLNGLPPTTTMPANDEPRRYPFSVESSSPGGGVPGARFRKHLARVLEFKTEHGRLPGCGRAPRDERNLGSWLYRQRRRWTAGEMASIEAEALDAALGPWWTLPPRKARKAESEALRGCRPERGKASPRSKSA